MLEIMIDLFLANHFCKDELTKKHFLKFVLNSKVIVFENKRVVLKKIVEESYPNFSKKIPKYYARLDKIRDLRNAFAHHQVDITLEGLELAKENQTIVLLDGSKERTEHKITSILEMIEDIRVIYNEIAKMTNPNK